MAPKRLFVYGVPEIITNWWVTYHDVEQNPKSYYYYLPQISRFLPEICWFLASSVTQDGETDGRTDGRTNIDIFSPPPQCIKWNVTWGDRLVNFWSLGTDRLDPPCHLQLIAYWSLQLTMSPSTDRLLIVWTKRIATYWSSDSSKVHFWSSEPSKCSIKQSSDSSN